MAYYDFAPADIDEMLSQVANFCSNDLAWSADYSGGVLSITPKPGEAVFRGEEGPGAYDRTGPEVLWEMEEQGDIVTCSMSHVTSTSLVWLHGGNSPEPWLLITVLSAPGIYRHTYLGYVARYGTWSGGAILDAVDWAHDYNNDDPLDIEPWADSDNHMLFSHDSQFLPLNRRSGYIGGVFVRGVHGNYPVARFCYDDSNDFPNDHPVAGGGFRDHYAMRFRDPGVMPLSGEAALVPITLFADMLRNDTWTPLGHTPGIRMVNIKELDPEEIYTYAGLAWRIFPLCRKTSGPFSTEDAGIAVLQET